MERTHVLPHGGGRLFQLFCLVEMVLIGSYFFLEERFLASLRR